MITRRQVAQMFGGVVALLTTGRAMARPEVGSIYDYEVCCDRHPGLVDATITEPPEPMYQVWGEHTLQLRGGELEKIHDRRFHLMMDRYGRDPVQVDEP